LLHDIVTNVGKRNRRRLQVLLDANHHRRIRVQFDHAAVGAVHQHFLVERGLDDLPIGRDAFAALTPERFGGLHHQTQFLRRLRQVGCFEGSIFQLFAGLHEALLDLLGLQLAYQLRLHAFERGNLR